MFYVAERPIMSVFAVIGFGILMMSIASSAIGIANKDGMKTSQSGHYIQYLGKTSMLIGDSGTQCVLQNLNLDYRRWIDSCASRGMTAIHVWALVPPRQKSDGSIIETRYGYVYPGATPWARKEDAPPGMDGFPQWDLTKFDEGEDPDQHYWPRIRDLVSYSREKGIIVGITVFFGWPKHNTSSRPDWSYHPFNTINGGFLKDDKSMTTVTQTIYSPGVEVLKEEWSENWPSEKKTQWVWEQFAQKLIDDTGKYGNTFYVFMDEHSYSEGNCGDHFLNFFKKRGAIYVDWDKRRASIDMVHDDARNSEGDGNSGSVAAFHAEPIKPAICLEAPPYMGDVVRRSIWTRAIGGMHYLFHNDERQENVNTGIMIYDPNVKGGIAEKVKERLDWLGHASEFFNQSVVVLDSMTPHNELTDMSQDAYCLANPGNEYAVYSWSGDVIKLDLKHAFDREFTYRFLNPRDGRWSETFRVSGGAVREIKKPDDEDWTLHVIINTK